MRVRDPGVMGDGSVPCRPPVTGPEARRLLPEDSEISLRISLIGAELVIPLCDDVGTSHGVESEAKGRVVWGGFLWILM